MPFLRTYFCFALSFDNYSNVSSNNNVCVLWRFVFVSEDVSDVFFQFVVLRVYVSYEWYR